MVSNSPNRVASHAEDGTGPNVLERVRQMFCGLHGHDSLLQYEQDRMFLKCVSCGHESPGWELNETPPTVSARGDDRRRVPVQLISARRVA
jgi:hypothetical protein